MIYVNFPHIYIVYIPPKIYVLPSFSNFQKITIRYRDIPSDASSLIKGFLRELSSSASVLQWQNTAIIRESQVLFVLYRFNVLWFLGRKLTNGGDTHDQ